MFALMLGCASVAPGWEASLSGEPGSPDPVEVGGGFVVRHCGPAAGPVVVARQSDDNLADWFGPWDAELVDCVHSGTTGCVAPPLSPGRYQARQGLRTTDFTVASSSARPQGGVEFRCEEFCPLDVRVVAADECASSGTLDLYAVAPGAPVFSSKSWRDGALVRWDAVPCGRVELRAEGDACAPEFETALLRYGASAGSPITLRMARPNGHCLTVVDAETGEPVPGARLRARSAVHLATTAADGTMCLPGGDLQSTGLVIHAAGYAPALWFATGCGEEDIEDRLLVRLYPTREVIVSCRHGTTPCDPGVDVHLRGNAFETAGARACEWLGEGTWYCAATHWDRVVASSSSGFAEVPVGADSAIDIDLGG